MNDHPHDSPTSRNAANAATSFLRITRARLSYDGVTVVLDDLSLQVAKGEMVALLGPSGCGKTSLLRAIAGLVPLDAGHIVLDGRALDDMPPQSRNIGVVFQNYALFPHMTVAENIAFGPALRRVPRAEREARVARLLDLVQMTGFADRKPHQLSGGQQQRVAIARALAIEPGLLLLDEPMSGLDRQLRDTLRVELRALQQRLGLTGVMVTHDQTDTFAVCDRVALLSRGTVLQYGTPQQLYDEPASLEIARFMGRTTILSGKAQDDRVTIGEHPVRVDAAGIPDGPVALVLRPHLIHLGPQRDLMLIGNDAAVIPGVVEQIFHAGDAVEYAVRVAGQRIDVSIPARMTLQSGLGWRSGDAVLCEWRMADARLFAA